MLSMIVNMLRYAMLLSPSIEIPLWISMDLSRCQKHKGRSKGKILNWASEEIIRSSC